MADLIQFDVPSGARIGRAVRAVENMRPAAKPLVFDPVLQVRTQKSVRFGVYSGAWPAGSSNVVTFTNLSTVRASNTLWPLDNAMGGNCAVAKDGTAWYLLVPQIEASTALSSVTLGSSLTFDRINVVSLGPASTVEITTTTCAT